MAKVTITIEDNPVVAVVGTDINITVSSEPHWDSPADCQGTDALEYIVERGTPAQCAALHMLIDILGTMGLVQMIKMNPGSDN